MHVPYTVSATIIADLLGGRIQASFVPMAFVLPLLQDGRLQGAGGRRQATDDRARSAIPTAMSQGVDYEYGTWYGMLAPGKTPKPVLTTLNQAMAEASKDPELLAKIRVQGIEPREIGLEQFDAHIRADMVRLDPVLKTVAEKVDQFSLNTLRMNAVTACSTCRVASGSWPRCGPSATQPSL